MKKLFMSLFVALTLAVGLAAQAPQVSISKLGQVYYADKYGVICDGNTGRATTNTTKLQALNNIIEATTDRTGTIILPSGTCAFNGSFMLGTSTSGHTAHISLLGQSPQTTIMSWQGLNGQAASTPAIFVSRNKGIEVGRFALTNGTIGSTSFDASSNIGIQYGGTASLGTQTFQVITHQLAVSNFAVCLQLGSNNANGSAASDMIFDELSLQYCNDGMLNTGNFNSLDIYFRNLLLGFNKIGLHSSTGNINVQGGSASYDGIDFKSDGFGYFLIENMRSEGPGRFFYGAEPNVVIRNSTIAEHQGSRQLTAVTQYAAANAHTVAATFNHTPVLGFYQITFSASAITNTDTLKYVMVQMGGSRWMVGLLRPVTSTTVGNIQLLYSTGTGSFVDEAVTVTVYDDPTCDMQFTNANTSINRNDVGAAVMSPKNGLLIPAIYNTKTKFYVSSVSSTTTAKCWMAPSQGGLVPLYTEQLGAATANLAGTGAGNVDNGVHKYYVTAFNSTTGVETMAGVVASVTVANKSADGKVALTAIPTGSSGTTERRIYRTAAGVVGASSAHLLTTLSDNVTTTYTDNSSDSTLSTAFVSHVNSRVEDTNPYVFDNVAIEWTVSGYQLTIDNMNMPGGIIKVRGGNNGGSLGNLRVTNSKTLAGPLGYSSYPITVAQNDNEWQITGTSASITDASIQNASQGSSIHGTGIVFGGANHAGSSDQQRDNYMLSAQGNTGAVYNSIEWPVPDFFGRVVAGEFEPFAYQTRPIEGSGSTGSDYGNHYDLGIGIRPENQLARVTSLGEFKNVGGHNLRNWCKFSASTTCTFTFARTENVTYSGSGSDLDNRSRAVKVTTDSGHFTVADLGKPISYSITDLGSIGTRTTYGWIQSIVDATHIWLQRSAGGVSLAFQGTAFGPISASVGVNEPDANYLVFLQCDDETKGFKVGSLATTGFTITASGSTSATCNVLIVR